MKTGPGNQSNPARPLSFPWPSRSPGPAPFPPALAQLSGPAPLFPGPAPRVRPARAFSPARPAASASLSPPRHQQPWPMRQPLFPSPTARAQLRPRPPLSHCNPGPLVIALLPFSPRPSLARHAEISGELPVQGPHAEIPESLLKTPPRPPPHPTFIHNHRTNPSRRLRIAPLRRARCATMETLNRCPLAPGKPHRSFAVAPASPL